MTIGVSALEGELPYLPLDLVRETIADARHRGDLLSGEHGFLNAWIAAGGQADRLPMAMRMRRMGFLQTWTNAPRDPLFVGKKGVPTRRHLAAVLWAYSPAPERLRVLYPGASGREALEPEF